MNKKNAPWKMSRVSGFTLIETLFAIIIVGLGVVAMMQLFLSGTEINSYGNKLSTGVIFAEHVRSLTDETYFYDLPDHDEEVFSGVEELNNFQVKLNVEAVNPEDMTIYVGPDPEMMRVTAQVNYKNKEITQLSWLRNR